MSDDEKKKGAKGEGGEGPEPYPYGKYEGGRDVKLDRHGYGRAILPNNDIYIGEYKHGLRHGKGLYCFKNGARYDGNWKKGLKHGDGTFYYPDGTKYVGHWRKDLKHCEGIYYYRNGDTYQGAWALGFRHGLGTYKYKSVNVTHFGIWIEGRMQGPAIIDYNCYKYHGKCDKNLPIGKGCFVFGSKYMQHGFYVNIKDPKFDYINAENLKLEEKKPEDKEKKPEDKEKKLEDKDKKPEEDKEFRGNPPGIIPIWHARWFCEFKAELLPPEPVAFPVEPSDSSVVDIMDYLKKIAERAGKDEEEEGYEAEHRLLPSPNVEEEF